MKVEKAREVRLWLVQVIAPISVVGAIVWNNCPNLRYSIMDKCNKVKNIFKKKELE